MASTTYSKYAEIYKNRTKSQDQRVSKLITNQLIQAMEFNQQTKSYSPLGRDNSHSPIRKDGSYAMQHLKQAADKNAYMSFLEVQLERVSASCLQIQGLTETIHQVQSQLHQQEEKTVNISRLVKLLQSYSDAQEEDSQNIKNQLKTFHQRLDEVIQSGVVKNSNYNSIVSAANNNPTMDMRKIMLLEDKIASLEEKIAA